MRTASACRRAGPWALMLGLLLGRPAFCATVTVLVLPSPELKAGQERRVLQAAEAALKEASPLRLTDAGKQSQLAGPQPARRGCVEERCLLELSGPLGVDRVLVLSARAPAGKLVVEGAWVAVAEKAVARKTEEGSLADPDRALRALVDGLLPRSERRGWGGLVLGPGLAPSKLKLDGRSVGMPVPGSALAVAAGLHQLDVLDADGRAVLVQLTVPEGQRVSVPPEAFLPAPAAAEPGRGLRHASYGLWTAGSVALAASFLAASQAQGQLGGVSSCAGTERDCSRWQDATFRQQRAEGYTRIANLLLGTGSALAVAGGGLFVFDLAWHGEEK